MPATLAQPDLAPEGPDFTLPDLDVRGLARRAAPVAAVAAVAAAALIVAGGPLQAFADALGRAVQADPRWVAGAAIFELLSFTGYIALFWMVGSRATPRLGLRASTQITLGGAAATRLLPTAGVGGAALTLWALRRTGLATRDATRTLLAFLVLLYSVFLIAIVTAGALLSLGLAHGDAPLTLTAVPAIGAAVAIALGLAAAMVRPAPMPADTSVRPASRLGRARTRVADGAGVLRGGIRDALALLRSGDARVLGAPAWWTFDAAVLWAMLNAFGAPPGLAVLALAYFVGQVGNTLPIPGAVSGGIVGVLVASGVEPDLALVSVLAYRSVAIWLPAPIGLLALRPLRRTIAAWGAEDAPAAPAAPAPEPFRLRALPSAAPAHDEQRVLVAA